MALIRIRCFRYFSLVSSISLSTPLDRIEKELKAFLTI